MLAGKLWAGNPSTPFQFRHVGVNHMTALCSLGSTSLPLLGKGTSLGKESKALSHYSLVPLTLFCFQEHTVLFFFFFFKDSAIALSPPWNVLLPEYCKVVTSYHSIIISNVTSSEVRLTHGLISLQNYLTDFVSVNKYFLSGIFPTYIVPCFQNTKRK